MRLSVVIPALNEEHSIGDVLREIPIAELAGMGYEVEVIVVDNGSVDSTTHVACMHRATVVLQPIRGYGNAYKAGFAYATGDVVATGDADLSYPFSDLPKILQLMQERQLEFVSTDRLSSLRTGVMTRSHVFGNWLLSLATKVLFGWPHKDSQSGMWIFKRYVWDALEVRSSGMPFSQEVKIEAFVRGFNCDEVEIDYRARAGETKLNTITDGLGNIAQLVRKRFSLGLAPKRSTDARSEDAVEGHGSLPNPSAACRTENAASSSLWEERWYRVATRSDAEPPGLGAYVTVPLLGAAATSSASAADRERMVVWRADRRRGPQGERASVRALPNLHRTDRRGPSHTHYVDRVDDRQLSPN